MLYRKNCDGVFLRCLEKRDTGNILSKLHNKPAGVNYGRDTISHKILRDGYYWPTLFKYSHTHVRKCHECQNSAEGEKKVAFPLQPINIEQPFQQWGVDMIGEINSNSSQMHKYILTSTDYFTRWSEEIPLNNINEIR